MWRLGTPMQVSHDINPHDNHQGIPPHGSPFYFLIDTSSDFLVDENDDFLVEDTTP